MSPLYSQLASSDTSEKHLLPVQSRRRHASALTVIVCLLVSFFAGFWSWRHIRKSESFDDDGSKGLIIASYTTQDVSWLSEIPSEWQTYRYIMDDPNHPDGLAVPRNFGREAMAYLTYIIDHYDNLPSYMVFTHGHYRSWHQVEPISWKIRALNMTSLKREKYISLRCGDAMGCERQPFLDIENPNWHGEIHLPRFWNHIMPQEPMPRYISFKCCGQHAITRDMVTRRSKEDWIRIRAPLLIEDLSPFLWAQPTIDEWLLGTWYEKIWHILLGPKPENCPSIEQCNQEFFSNAITCDRGTDLETFDSPEVWIHTRCQSAFDGLGRDQPANITLFHRHIIEINDLMRMERAKEEEGKRERLEAWERLQQEQKDATPPPPEGGASTDEASADQRPASSNEEGDVTTRT